MAVIWIGNGIYRRDEYRDENDLEKAINEVQFELFGANRIYLDIKKKIGLKGGQRNIPDGYLIDLNGRKPRVYVVENELAIHDPLRHIALQILQFSLSFKSEPRIVRTVLFDSISSDLRIKAKCEEYAQQNRYRNLDHLIDEMVFDSPFAALVIIDEIPSKLEKILAEEFRFGVEVLSLARYRNQAGEHLYFFEPFLADLNSESGLIESSLSSVALETDEIDTVVVPAHKEGFERTFLAENRWHAVRMHGTVRPQIKYIAVYQIRPVSAITHIAPVQSIEPWGDEGKFVLNFSEAATKIEPIRMIKGGRVKTFQNLRYTSLERLKSAKTLDDVFLE